MQYGNAALASGTVPPIMPSPARPPSVNDLRPPKKATSKKTVFDVKLFLESNGPGRKIAKFRNTETIFAQGDPGQNVFYIHEGRIKLTVVNKAGKEAVVEILGPGDFLGLRCLSLPSVYTSTATAIVPTTVLVIEKDVMIRVLREERELSNRFIDNMLAKDARGEEALIDHLFNSIEKRLAGALYCCWRVMARMASLERCFPEYRKRCWRK